MIKRNFILTIGFYIELILKERPLPVNRGRGLFSLLNRKPPRAELFILSYLQMQSVYYLVTRTGRSVCPVRRTNKPKPLERLPQTASAAASPADRLDAHWDLCPAEMK